MVHFVRLLSTAAALMSVTSAAPMMRRDSAIGEEEGGVSAPNGIVLSGSPTSTAGSYETSSSYDSNSSDNSYSSSSYDNSYSSSSNDNSYSTSSYDNSYSSSSNDNSYSTSTYDNSYSSSSYDNSYSSSTYGNGYESSSSSSYDTTSTMMSESTSIMMSESTSTMMSESTSTSTAYMSYSTYSYGSGSSNWGGNGYNDCVMQCAASFGMPSATWTPPTATQDSSMESGSSGSNGVTHTIIVAPTAGVFRYVPFSTNASVGDTIHFHWNAGPHTVTQSSGLELCNKTSAPNAFDSGDENAGTSWNMVINDTKPIWFYCGVKTHCKQGMFGGINIGQPNPDMQGSSSSDYVSLGSMAENITSSNSDMMAAWQYTKSKTGSNAYANNWGMSINVVGMDDEAKMQVMNNVLWTQTLIAANPDAVDKDKGFQVSDKNLTIPGDISNAIAQAPAPSAASSGAATAAGPTSSAAAGTSAAASGGSATPSGSAGNGAVSVASSSVAFGFVAIVASFLML